MPNKQRVLSVIGAIGVSGLTVAALVWEGGRPILTGLVGALMGYAAVNTFFIERSVSKMRNASLSPSGIRELVRRELKSAGRREFAQVEALAVLLARFPPEVQLPASRGWAASPDLSAAIVRRIQVTRPTLVVELGSGLSTYWIARALKDNGTGRVVSIEHDEAYAAQTRALLAQAGLTDVAEVRVAPLKVHSWPQGTELWYEVSALHGIDSPDILVVDGPPNTSSETYRWPAVWHFESRLKPGGSFIFDDTTRDSEMAMVRLLTNDLGYLAEDLHCEKGAVAVAKPAV